MNKEKAELAFVHACA